MPTAIFELKVPTEGFAPQKIVIDGLMVITGLNGAGKTRLLNLFAKGAYRQDDFLPDVVIQQRPVWGASNFLIQNGANNQIWINLQNERQSLDVAIKNPAAIDPETNRARFPFYYIAEKLGKSLEEVTVLDYIVAIPIGLQLQISQRIEAYQYKFWSNQRQKMIDAHDGTKIAFSDDEFLRHAGEPPWEAVNRIMEKSGFPYKILVQHPAPYRTDVAGSHHIERLNGAKIDYQHFSAGEKIIFGMLVHQAAALKMVDVLLLDEVDSALHPKAIHDFVKHVQEIIVDRLNIPVVFVTHSPTTVAISGEKSLYALRPSADGQLLEKVTRDEAFEELCAGLPMLNVSMSNRRIVFTESDYDAKFYEDVYFQIKELLKSDYALSFFPAGLKGDSNSSSVRHVVGALAGGALSNVFGVIDHDGSNESTESLKVLAEGVAYTLENVLLDPLLMAIFLRTHTSIRPAEIGLEEAESVFQIFDLDQARLQGIADAVFDLYQDKRFSKDQPRVKWNYLNGRWVDVPVALLMEAGHPLALHVASLPKFGAVFKGNQTSALQSRMPAVIRDHKGWTPMVIFELLQSLAPQK